MFSERKTVPEVRPFGVLGLNQIDLPLAWIILDAFLASNGVFNAIMRLEPDEPFDTIALCEALNQSFAVLIDTAHQIIGDAAIERPMLSTGHEVDEVHGSSMAAVRLVGNVTEWIPRIKRGMTCV